MSVKHFLRSNSWKTPDTYDSTVFHHAINGPAVYIFLAFGSLPIVAYAGMSSNLAIRWKNHEIYSALATSLYVQRWFKPTPVSELRDTERLLLHLFDPPYNINGRPRGIVY